ncbi:MAG: hypothetical protein OEW04_06055 [Nitrospirota bacterium]|nr:hypothetical protein [Nitrospirota bacterium]
MRYRRLLRSMVMASMLLINCAPSTFIISKDGRAYYFGRKSRVLHEMLCESGDFEKILAEASIAEDIKKDFYKYSCTEQHTEQKVISLYLFLSPEEKV